MDSGCNPSFRCSPTPMFRGAIETGSRSNPDATNLEPPATFLVKQANNPVRRVAW
ncbi:hypothetical protein RISK_004548 [Rhodopirellula islandica]|uniref:Uncharacterized protein n=1 Tax=Rhodopirellula islandica TaxID=595434 RepID=A0A0J1B9T6_RHOIS|nr:hypothetical protein RISK_004548 [Rhodopirellula islandica]